MKSYSNYLKSNGLRKNDVVVTRASQDIDYVVVYFGVHLAGGVVASLERGISNTNMLEISERLNASMIIADDLTSTRKVLPRRGIVELARNYECRENSGLIFPQPDDSADILYTTGTTGASKGVELSHRALTATAENLACGCGYKPETTMILPGPLNHANAIRKLHAVLYRGSAICLLNGLADLKAFFTALETIPGNVACCLPPAAIRIILSLTGDTIGNYRDKIDFIESATAPLPEPDKIRLTKLLPYSRLYNLYGSSETGSISAYDYNKYAGKISCIGKPLKNAKIFFVDDNYNEINSSPDNLGLLACIGDVNMKGYYNDPDETSKVLKNGVLYTNDMGYMDDEGFIYVTGRRGDVINVGGLKVAPTEVESVALGYAGINDCICIPVDDRITGHALKLLIVVDEKCYDSSNFPEYLAQKLEPHKIPKFIEKTDAIHKTYNGKIDRKFYVQHS